MYLTGAVLEAHLPGIHEGSRSADFRHAHARAVTRAIVGTAHCIENGVKKCEVLCKVRDKVALKQIHTYV